MRTHPDDWAGTVRALFITQTTGAPLEEVTAVRAVAGAGLEGDRHFNAAGAAPDEQLTLVAREAIEAANREHGLALGLGDTYRNVLTEGVPLNALVGREFTVGEVRARGIELCEPCARLQQLTGKPVIKALVHRGGLRAEILAGGTIRAGDAVRPG